MFSKLHKSQKLFKIFFHLMLISCPLSSPNIAISIQTILNNHFYHSYHCYSSNMPPIWLKRYKPLEVLFSFFHCKCIPHIQSHLSQRSWLRIHVHTEALFFMLWFLASHGILHQYPFFEFFFFHLVAFMYLKNGLPRWC